MVQSQNRNRFFNNNAIKNNLEYLKKIYSIVEEDFNSGGMEKALM